MAISLKRFHRDPSPSYWPPCGDHGSNAIAAIVLGLGIVAPFWACVALVIYFF